MRPEKRARPHKVRRDELAAQLFLHQHGVISRAQALEVGFTPSGIGRRTANGTWICVYPGTYRLASFPTSIEQPFVAARFALGARTAASHRGAAFLLDLDGVDTPMIEVSVEGTARSPLEGVIVHRVKKLPECDITNIRGIPTTNAGRTLIDLGGVEGDETVEMALEDALRRGLTSLPRLRWRIEDLCRRGRPGCATVRRVLEQRGVHEPTASALETRLARLIRKSNMPTPVRQFEIRDGARFVARADFAYPDIKVAIEADSFRWHSSRAAWERELQRRNDMQKLGWMIIHVTRKDIDERPHKVVESIRFALHGRGRSNARKAGT